MLNISLVHPRRQPSFVQLTDLPLFVMCMQMFWRKDLSVSHELVCEFWKNMGIPLTGELAKLILNICGPKGDNGKSTLIKIIKKAIGSDLYGDIMISALTKDNDAQNASPAFVPLIGAYYGIISETDSSKLVLSHIIKHLTGGDDFMIRNLYQDIQTVPLNLIIVAAGNSAMTYDKVDGAIRHRSKYFVAWGQYSENAPESEREQWEQGIFEMDLTFSTDTKRIMEYAEQALILMTYFAQKYKEDGLKPNEDMDSYKDYYLSGSTPQIMFIKECLTPCESSVLSIDDVYIIFSKWFNVKYVRQIAPSRDSFVAQLKACFPGYVSLSQVTGVRFTDEAAIYGEERGDYVQSVNNTNPIEINKTQSPTVTSPFST